MTSIDVFVYDVSLVVTTELRLQCWGSWLEDGFRFVVAGEPRNIAQIVFVSKPALLCASIRQLYNDSSRYNIIKCACACACVRACVHACVCVCVFFPQYFALYCHCFSSQKMARK